VDRRFASLGRDTKQIIRALLESKNAVKDEFETQSKSLLQFEERAHEKTRSVLIEQVKERCGRKVQLAALQALRFKSMTYRHETIAEAHCRTFEWIFQDRDIEGNSWSKFSEWLESGSGIYWIKGKAGSGKST
jgi:hypothetical protein